MLMRQRLQPAGLDWGDLPETLRRLWEQPVRLREALLPGWPVDDAEGPLLRAALGLALDFTTRRTLVRDQGLDEERAVELLVQLIVCALVPA
jgi:hypothetical protein